MLVYGPWKDPQGFGFPQSRMFTRCRAAADDPRGHAPASRRRRRAAGRGRRLGRDDPDRDRLRDQGRGPGAGGRGLRRLRSQPDDLALPLDQRRARRARRAVRDRGPDRPADPGADAGLRLHRDHRRVPRQAASARHHPLRPADGALLHRRRERPGRGRPAAGGDRRVPGPAAVLPARDRFPHQVPRPLGYARAGRSRPHELRCHRAGAGDHHQRGDAARSTPRSASSWSRSRASSTSASRA